MLVVPGASEGPGPRAALWLALAVAALFVVSAGFRLGAAPISERAELRVHDVAVGMLATGDWIVPMRNGEPRLNKPPLTYWAVAAASVLAGHHDTAVLRLPALLSGLGLVLLVMLWGWTLGGPRLGLLAGVLLTCTVGVHGAAREGTAELLLACACQAALVAFERHHHRRGAGAPARPLALWACLAALVVAILAKATAALLIIGLPLALHLALRGELRAALRPRLLGLLALACLLGFAWYGVVMAVLPGAAEAFLNALVLPAGVQAGSSGGPAAAGHFGGVHEQLVNLLELAMPQTLLLPLVVWRARVTGLWRERPGLRLAALVVLSLLLAFSLLPQKRPHYLLPLLPSLALLSADAVLAAAAGGLRRGRRAWSVYGALALAIGLLATAGGVFWLGWLRGLPPALVAPAALAGLALAVTAWRSARRGRLAALATACALGTCGLFALHDDVDGWRRSVKTGVVERRADYDGQLWASARADLPWLLGAFEPDDRWPSMLADDPAAWGTEISWSAPR